MAIMISIIVPIYNCEQFLPACIDSILAQSYQDFEILLVDDGSNDQSGGICDQYASQDTRIRVFHRANSGVSASRNFGIENAKGAYVSFVDSDDRIHVDFLAKLLERLLSTKADFTYCDIVLDNPDGERVYTTYTLDGDKKSDFHKMLREGWGALCFNKLYKKNFLEKADIRFPEDINYCEDVLFSIQAFWMAKVIEKVPEALYYYNRRNVHSATHAMSLRLVNDSLKAMDAMVSFFKQYGLYDEYRNEINWKILLCKSELVFRPEEHRRFLSSFPESNHYIWSNPYLHRKLQLLMWLVNIRQGWLVQLILKVHPRS